MRYHWLVTTIGLGFLFQVISVVNVRAISLDDCKSGEYVLKDDKKCRPCTPCPRGKMYKSHCGYEFSKGEIKQVDRDPCKPCETGATYKGAKSTYACIECSPKCGKHRDEIHPCNATHDRKCSDCKRGFYEENGDCHPCQLCCGTNPFSDTFRNEFIRQKCIRDNMGQCSCRPIEGCNKKCPFNDTKVTPFPITAKTNSVQLIPTSAELTRLDPFTGRIIHHKSESQLSTKTATESVDLGWPIAVVICFLFICAILLFSFVHSNSIKKIKLLDDNDQKSTHEPREVHLDIPRVVCVSDKFGEEAKPDCTNFAQLLESPEENSTENLHSSQQTISILDTQGNDCRLESSISSRNESAEVGAYHAHDGPWIRREVTNPRKIRRWPPTRHSRAGMSNRSSSVLEENMQLQHAKANGSGGNSKPSQEDKSEHDNNNACKVIRKQVEKEKTIIVANRKNGEENSEEEETVIVIPVSVENAKDKTFKIAGGRHSETRNGINDVCKTAREETSKTSKEKKTDGKKSGKTPDHRFNSRHFRSDIFQCSCGECSYRPYERDLEFCNCKICTPQPDDDLYKIIERQCLKAEFCKELNKDNVPNWRDLLIYIRKDKQIQDIKNTDNPAQVVFEILKTSRPRMSLKDFRVILKKIQRHDVMEVIMSHHITCKLCRRNSFDDSFEDLHLQYNSKSLDI